MYHENSNRSWLDVLILIVALHYYLFIYASSCLHRICFADYGYGLIDPAEIPRGPDIITQPDSIIVSD